MLGVVKVSGPIAPDPPAKTTAVMPIMLPVPEMVPVPVAVIVSVVPETLALITTPPLVPEAASDKVPVALTELDKVSAPAPLAESIKLKLAPVDAPLPVIACVLVMVTFPVVLAVTFGVDTVSGPMSPD